MACRRKLCWKFVRFRTQRSVDSGPRWQFSIIWAVCLMQAFVAFKDTAQWLLFSRLHLVVCTRVTRLLKKKNKSLFFNLRVQETDYQLKALSYLVHRFIILPQTYTGAIVTMMFVQWRSIPQNTHPMSFWGVPLLIVGPHGETKRAKVQSVDSWMIEFSMKLTCSYRKPS